MKTRKEFLTACMAYFGDPGETVIDLIADDLKYVKPTDYKKIFDRLICTHPASWNIDFKSYIEAVKACNILLLDSEYKERKCLVCGTVRHTSGGCPRCKYYHTDGSPEEYRKFWEGWKSGQIDHVDVKAILHDLAKEKRMERTT